MKVDLHCHTLFSGQPSEWILQKLGFPESYTTPRRLYDLQRARGMTHVTITDHDSIQGALEIAGLENTFISEEVTTYFPEDRCKLHVLVYNIREKNHHDIQRIRGNVYDLVDYLTRRNIPHAVAHPLFSMNGKMGFDNFEKILLLFKTVELNGSRNEAINKALLEISALLTREDINRLMEKHKILPPYGGEWKKSFVGGSDDHSALTLGSRYTEVNGVSNPRDFFEGVHRHESRVIGGEATPHSFARNLYSIAYQYYKNKLKKNPELGGDIILTVLDRFLSADPKASSRKPGFFTAARYLWKRGFKKPAPPSAAAPFFDHFRFQIRALAEQDPSVRKTLSLDTSHQEAVNEAWFELVQKVSARLLAHFNTQQLRGLFQADFPALFQSMASTGVMYAGLAPYILAYSLFRKDITFSRQIVERFKQTSSAGTVPCEKSEVKVAHFTDTFHEINGVALTLKRQVLTAQKTGKDYTLITCDSGQNPETPGVKHFKPMGSFRLDEYREQKFYYPPFFEMLDYCYREGFTHIHSSTPGPIGLAALAVARTLGLPLVGTYHTAFPQYVSYFVNDNAMEGAMWQGMLWYYSQMDAVFAPSHSTRMELLDKGLSPDKVLLYPRGVDTLLFSPSRKTDFFKTQCRIFSGNKLLYVGRISKEKNLPQLARVYRSLLQKMPDTHLIVVGTGPYLEDMKRELAGTPAIFTGDLKGEALSEVYASSDLFVFPSTTDTFGNVVLEAQASGLPVIVTDSGGPQENILPGETGCVVKSNDDGALKSALLTLLSKPEKMLRMGKAARMYMESRSFEVAFDAAWKLYSTIGTKKSAASEDFSKDTEKVMVKASGA